MLSVVSLGPGSEDLMVPKARKRLEDAGAIVGYKGYMDMVAPEMLEGKTVVSTGMTGEVERSRQAIELAKSGVDTVVISSGDAGIYAMAGLVLEMLEADGLLETVEFEVVPGVPAFVAASALLGAPLMHDFASVSLSDLLTPWETIEKRLDAAAGADFVMAIYNPRSKKRVDQLPRALEIIGRYRAGSTPIGVVREAERPEQSIRITTLEALDVETVDMKTVLVIGNSATRETCGKMLTPRGYHTKYDISRKA